MHLAATLPMMAERTSTLANMVFSWMYAMAPRIRNRAAVKPPMVPSNWETDTRRSTWASTCGAIYSCTTFRSTSKVAVSRQNSSVRFLLPQAVLIIQPTF